ncbi:hypothetical protein [Brevibacillus brevis]|uniref:hypothetical protein n=1 Tax=Brevibacillus brevis TaxID=1393 RepID=UPI00165DE35D|nr:hypothetical protein [Brevibacillus brevis]
MIGYNGLAGREYFQPDFSYTILNGDVLLFALVVERAIEQFNKSNDIFMEKSINASNYIQKNYSIRTHILHPHFNNGAIMREMETVRQLH